MSKSPEPRLSFYGVGPRIMIPSLLTTLLAGIATRYWPEICVVHVVPRFVSILGGILLLVIGVASWLLAGFAVMQGYREDRLVTSGLFGVVRNPIYSAWIVLIFPGIALFCRSWPFLLSSLVGYLLFLRHIHLENEYLEKRFGDAYRTYKAKVNALIPFPKRKSEV